MIELDSIKAATLRTLIYSDIFDYPLKPKEIHLYLIGEESCSQQEIVGALGDLKRLGLIDEKEGLFFLKNREEACDLRKEREDWSEEKLVKTKKIAWLFRLILWVRLVAVTGAAAAGNADNNSDIDLMIVADSKRIWLTRFLVLGLLKISGLRVDIKRELMANRFCVNLFIADDCLEYPQKNLYTANEIVRIKPIFERNGFYQKFLAANQWVSSFLPNLKSTKAVQPERLNAFNLSGWGGGDFFEKIARDWQFKKIRQNYPKTKNLPENELLLYQPNDCRQKILVEFERKCKCF